MSAVRERDVERYLTQRVKAAGGEARKVAWVGRRGAPDRLVMLPGRMPTFVELKRPGAVPDLHQAREIALLQRFGCQVLVLDSTAGVDALLDGGAL